MCCMQAATSPSSIRHASWWEYAQADACLQVDFQRRMLQEYEKREKARKVGHCRMRCRVIRAVASTAPLLMACLRQVREIQTVCPDASKEEALKALELCDGRYLGACAPPDSASATLPSAWGM